MKTDQWIDLLAADAQPVARGAHRRRMQLLFGTGAVLSAVLAGTWMGWRSLAMPDLEDMRLWWRWLYCIAVAFAAWHAVNRLARPGQRLHGVVKWLLMPLLAIGALALIQLGLASPEERLPLLMGSTSLVCPWSIAALAVPSFIGAFWVMKKMAPTQPVWAGAAAGLFAGALGALGYTFHCHELDPPFIAVWYSMGMLLPAAAGALLGPRLLRW